MSSARVPLLLAAALCLAGASVAGAETKLRGTYIKIDDANVDPIPGGQNGSILYLNRCAGGCTVTSGSDSSITDRSSIVGGTVFLSAWVHGDEAWDQLVRCVQGVFEPFNVQVTDQDPGVSGHHEVMVAGTDTEFGFDGALGVSPFTCTPINNSLTFVFANLTSSVPDLCWAAAQEPGHSWGIDHLYLCEDPMTYLTAPCGNNKYAFQNTQAQCHDQDSNPVPSCSCGQATQNSFQTITSLFGPGPGEGPAIDIVRPSDGATVGPGFPVEANVTDTSKIQSVDLYVNGNLIFSATNAPYVFNAPIDLTSGNADVEIRSVDVHGFSSTESIAVTVDPDANPDGEPGESGGCSSTGAGFGGLWLVLLALAAARRPRPRLAQRRT
jgi:hypothetical protein